MNLAEFFIKITATGLTPLQEGLGRIETRLEGAAKKTRGFALAIDVLDTGIIALMRRVLDMAVGFNKFNLSTGESIQTLQRWQYAARIANVAGGDVVASITSIQDAQAQIALGAGNVAPWQLLGIDPRQDPFEVLQRIHERIQGLQPGVARVIARQFGLSDDMIGFLRRPNLGLPDIKQKMLIDDQQEDSLLRLNSKWQDLSWKIDQASVALAEKLEPAFLDLIPKVEALIKRFDRWLDTLHENDVNGFVAKINKLVEVLLVAGPALSGIAAGLTAMSVAFGVAQLAADPLLATLLAIAAAYVGAFKAGQWLGDKINGVDYSDRTPVTLNRYANRPVGAGPGNTTNIGQVNIQSPDPAKAGDSVVSLAQKSNSATIDQMPFAAF